MGTDINSYIANSIHRFPIKKIGYHTESHMAFIVLEDDLVFYGMPGKNKNFIEDILVGTVDIIQNLEYRYFQTNRKLNQHSRYQYKPGDVVVELGSFIGYYTMYAAKQVGPTGKVISVEMIPENYEVLKLNLATNYPGNTVAIKRGIHKKKGLRTAYAGGNQLAGFRKDVITQYEPNVQEISVEMDTVDNILQENGVTVVDLMIIQVNGNEIDALQGMSKSIQTVRNFAIAAPYDSEGVDHKKIISDYLNENRFDVEVDPPWVYARSRTQIKKA